MKHLFDAQRSALVTTWQMERDMQLKAIAWVLGRDQIWNDELTAIENDNLDTDEALRYVKPDRERAVGKGRRSARASRLNATKGTKAPARSSEVEGSDPRNATEQVAGIRQDHSLELTTHDHSDDPWGKGEHETK